jgi:glyoxylase-like metal-dependent hydrolase (beta-lactamase superfamily II)
MIKIEKVINNPVPSNCYVITNGNTNSCIIVDPGTQDCKELLSLLQQKNLIPEYIILTHEHIDHTIGIEELLKHFKAKIICSLDCNKNINSLKYNLNGYSEKYEEKIDLPTADIILENINYLLQWDEYTIQFYKAEGHSIGSIIFK